jgi:signal peptide peptidase SppA
MSNRIGQLRRALRGSVGRPVAYQMRDGFGATLAPTLERVLRGQRVPDGELFRAVAEEDAAQAQWDAAAQRLAAPLVIPAGKGGKATALVSVRGIATYDLEFQPLAFSTLLLSQTMAALANDPEIGTVILDVDSPGGMVTGTPEAADAVFAARDGARVVALLNPLAASAAYWIASQASEVVAVPSGEAGSIGVFMLHTDCSAMLEMNGIKPTFIFATDSPFKVEGNAYEPLGDVARTHFQEEVDAVMAQFVKAVARGRGVDRAKVLADFGQGRTLTADDARKVGMIDRVATMTAAMARWGVSAATLQGRRRGEAFGPDANAAAAPQPAPDEQSPIDPPQDPDPGKVEPDEDPAGDPPAPEGAAPSKTKANAVRRRLALLRH